MRRFLLLALLLGCAESPETSVSTGTTTTATEAEREKSPAAPAAPPGERRAVRNVEIHSPTPGDVIRSNPITVRGEARTFENNVAIRIFDSQGMLLKETFTTATGEMGKFSPFEKEIFLTRDPGRQVTVQAFEYSAKDGSIQHLHAVTVPVELRTTRATLFVPAEDCPEVRAIEREIPVSPAMARLLVEALLEDPIFPKGSQVRSVNMRRGVVTVDFNERLTNVGGSCRVQAIRASIERTLKQLPSVQRVRITAMGSESTALQP